MSTGTALVKEKADAIRDGSSNLASWADSLQSFGTLAKQIPVVGKSVGQVLDLGDVFRNNVLQPVDDLLANNPTPSPDQIKSAIQTVLDALPTNDDSINVVLEGDELRFDIQFAGSQTTAVPLNLGNNSAGVAFDGNANVTGTLQAGFSFGLDMADGLAPEEAFFIDLNGPTGAAPGLKAGASIDIKDFSLDGRVSVLEVKLGDGPGGQAESLKAAAEVGVAMKSADGRATISDLQNTTLGGLVNLTTGPATGGLSAQIPVSGALGSFNGSATLNVSDDNLLTDPAPSVSLTGGNFQQLLSFKELSPSKLVSLIQEIGASLQTISNGLNSSGGIPFVGSALNQAVNFADMLTDMTEGLFDVNLAGASAYTATNPAATHLSQNAVFTLSVIDTTTSQTTDDDVVATKVITIAAGDYPSIASLVGAIQSQINGTALADKVAVAADGSRVRFTAKNAGQTLAIRFAASNDAMKEVGFQPTLTNAVFKFDSLQSLVPLLVSAMNLPDAAGLGMNYVPGTNSLEFNLKFNRAFNRGIDIEFTDEVNVGVGTLALTGGLDADVEATANLDVTLGVKLAPQNNVLPLFVKDGGKVSASARFKGTGDLAAGLGILELGVDNADADFTVGGGFTINDPTPADGGLFASEFLTGQLNNNPAIENPTFTAGGDVELPLKLIGAEEVGITLPAGAKVTLKFIANPTVTLDADVTGVEDFIKQFTNFSTENVFAVLKQLVGFIQNSDIKLFNEPLPLVNKSIKELLAFASQIVDGLNGSTEAIKSLKSVFFNGGKTTKTLIQGVASAITGPLLTALQQTGGEAAKAGVKLQQAKDQLNAALNSMQAEDLQLTANLVSALGLVVQAVAQLNTVPNLPPSVTGPLDTLSQAIDPIRDALPKIQSLKDVLAATPVLGELNKIEHGEHRPTGCSTQSRRWTMRCPHCPMRSPTARRSACRSRSPARCPSCPKRSITSRSTWTTCRPARPRTSSPLPSSGSRAPGRIPVRDSSSIIALTWGDTFNRTASTSSARAGRTRLVSRPA
jgi:hypothetical protein